LELVGGLAGLLDDAAGLGLGVVQLGPVLGQQLLGLGPLLLGRLEVVADPLGAGVHRLAHGRQAELGEEEEHHQEADRAPDDLVHLGQEDVRRLLAVVDRAAALEDLDALLLGVPDLGLALALLRTGRAGQRQDEAESDRRQGQQHVPASHGSFLVAVRCVRGDQAWPRKKTTKPIRARASTKAMPRNIVVRTMPAASGWRAMAWTDWPTR